jgi:hypothetical protein
MGAAMEFLLAACGYSNFTEIEAYRNCSQSKRELRLRHTLGRGLPDTVAAARYHRFASRRSTIALKRRVVIAISRIAISRVQFLKQAKRM